MRSVLLLALLSLALALPSARLNLKPQGLMPDLFKMLHNACKGKYCRAEEGAFYFSGNSFEENKFNATMDMHNQTLNISYAKKATLYIYSVINGKWTYKGSLYDFTVDSLLISYSANGTFAPKVKDFKYSSSSTISDAVKQTIDDNIPKAIDAFLGQAVNATQKYFAQETNSYWQKYDMHLAVNSSMEVAENYMPFLDMSARLSHSYSAVAPNSSLPAGQDFPLKEGSSLSVSESVFNAYLASAYSHGAFNIDMSGKAIQVWKKWLNLELGDLDIGFVKAMLPEFDSDLDDNTLLDLKLSAQEVPVVSFMGEQASLTLRLSAALSYQNTLLGSLNVDGLITHRLHFNKDTESLDLEDLDFKFSSLTFLDEEQKEVHTGSALALNALAQLATPALIEMANLKGLNLRQFAPSAGLLAFTPTNVLLSNSRLLLHLQPAFVQNTDWTDITKLLE